jgi:hypothetical protein
MGMGHVDGLGAVRPRKEKTKKTRIKMVKILQKPLYPSLYFLVVTDRLCGSLKLIRWIDDGWILYLEE